MKLLGRVLYWIIYPLLALYLRMETRGRVVIWHDNKVLLVKSWLDKGDWYLPGGGIHRGEDFAAGSARELYEETGIDIRPNNLELIESFRYRDGLIRYDSVVFCARLASEPHLRLQKTEITEARWFELDEIKNLNVDKSALRSVRKSLK